MIWRTTYRSNDGHTVVTYHPACPKARRAIETIAHHLAHAAGEPVAWTTETWQPCAA